MAVTPDRSIAIRRSPAFAWMRRHWDSNSSTHGPASRPWRANRISDADSIVSIFSMALTQGSLTLLPQLSLHNACHTASRRQPDLMRHARVWAEPDRKASEHLLRPSTFQVQSSSRDGIITNRDAL